MPKLTVPSGTVAETTVSGSTSASGDRRFNAFGLPLSAGDLISPTLLTAELLASTLTLTYDEPLDPLSQPSLDSFVVTANGSAIAIIDIGITDSTVTLTLDADPADTASVILDYTPDSSPIADLADNPALALADQAVVVSDATPPTLQSALFSDFTITLTYDEALDELSEPDPTDFAITANGEAVAINRIDVDDRSVRVILDSVLAETDTVSLDYAPGAEPIQDEAENRAAPVFNQVVSPLAEPGFTLSKAATTVTEAGTTDTFTIVLDRPTSSPTSIVVLTITSSDPQEAIVSPPQLVFTFEDWSRPQTVTITGVDDGFYDGLETTVTLTISVNEELTADEFDALEDQTVNVTSVHVGPTPFRDQLTYADGPDVVFALEGNDVIRGLGGNDNLFGQEGNDRLIAAEGNDRVAGGDGNDRLLGGDGNDRLLGNAGNDRLVGGEGTDTLLAGIGDDTIVAGSENDRLLAAGGDDLMRGNLGNDTLNGGAGTDRQFGGAGNDRLNGQGGNDNLRGGGDRDVLSGGTGDDRLAGELGNDVIITGAGNDVVVIQPGQGQDRVRDFDDGRDRLDIGRLTFGQLTLQQRGANTLISANGERLLLLQGIRTNQITQADII
ncbi:MAG: SwmB domain-containing protein [Cyanobacteria bacterium J06638_22]